MLDCRPGAAGEMCIRGAWRCTLAAAYRSFEAFQVLGWDDENVDGRPVRSTEYELLRDMLRILGLAFVEKQWNKHTPYS